ncbi:MAG TPA: membrane protein insertase YidC [Bryobacteraceae bacterium]|jgi:YidC/Oxa1 family membrane protein insertase|nr:membrane protein insertase YidC [Bryobacteraceae bacterium]
MKKELSMEARLLIAFVLMGLVLFLTPYIYKPSTAPAPGANSPAVSKTTDVKEASTLPPPAEAVPVPPVAAAAEMPGQIHGDKEETVVVDTNLYRIVFSNKGAVVQSWVLKDFKDHEGKLLDLVDPAALAKVPAPFSIDFRNQKPTTDPNLALFKVDRAGDDLTFEFSDGRMDVKKTFQFGKDSYLARVTSQVSQNGVMLPHSLEWRGGFGDETIANPAPDQHALLYDANAPRSYGIFSNELQKKDASSAKGGPVTSSGQYMFAGIEDSYFTGVFLPAGSSTMELTTYSDQVPKDGKDVPRVGAAVGGEGFNSFELYVGPKDIEILKRVNPKLELVVDWGKFGVVAKPLFEALKWMAGKVGGNYGWAIILVTIAINTLLFPLKITSMKSSKKMQSIQPQIAAINAKYKGLSLNDPKKADQNAEIMALYKDNGVNPAGGCLPMLLQLPFFFAFYAVLGVAIQLRGAHWLWVSDLSQPESLAIHVLPLILTATQFLTQKMTPSPGVDPTQQKMMLVMPLVLGYMFYFAKSGLVIYWLTGNVVGIAQQWFLNRGTPKPSPKVVDVKPVPKKKK